MNKTKETIRKITASLLLSSLLWGCGQGEENIEKEQPVENSEQTEEIIQTEEEVISDDSVAFADATMKETISEACKGEPDKEQLEAITVLRLSLSKDEEPIAVLDDLALLPNLEQLYIEVQPECEKQMVLDYGYLKNMDELTELTIHDEYLSDISFVKQMKALQCLDVSDCNIEDYAGLEYLPELDNLFIGGNPGDPLQVLQKRGAEVLTASAEDKEAWKN
ncbi:MAG: hypothetical protein K2J04_02115, partial [Lachnospiraceae bacterium]|nr:hypothetical protein [Lachnospiraceae bacterium]